MDIRKAVELADGWEWFEQIDYGTGIAIPNDSCIYPVPVSQVHKDALAAEFGISHKTVGSIVGGRSWKHIKAIVDSGVLEHG